MKRDTQKKGFLALIIALLNFISSFLSKNADKRKQEEINRAKEELRKALSEGRITDAAYWNKKVNQLEAAKALNKIARSKLLLLLILLPLGSGCASIAHHLGYAPIQAPITPVIIGERLNKVNPGDSLKVPPLTKPAKQWYLVDDVGLYQWLDLKTP